MRSDLKAVDGIGEIETDLDEQTCSFEIDASIDVEELIDGLAKKNSKLKEWTRVDTAPN